MLRKRIRGCSQGHGEGLSLHRTQSYLLPVSLMLAAVDKLDGGVDKRRRERGSEKGEQLEDATHRERRIKRIEVKEKNTQIAVN